MAVVLLFLLGAIAPAVFLLHFFYVRDKYHRDPLRRILKVYFISFLSVVPAVLLELGAEPLIPDPWAAFPVGIIEEGVKFLFFWWLVRRLEDFDEPYDGILYAVAVSLGFATVENLLYVLGSGSLFVVGIRAVFSVPGHCLWGVIMGYYLGKWRFETDPGVRRGLVLRAFLIPAFLHGLFDFLIFASEDTGGATLIGPIVIVIGQWIAGMKMVHKAQEASPFKRPNPMQSPLAALDMRYKYCQHCGARGLRDDRYCSKCGLPHPEPKNPTPVPVIHCDQCGTNVLWTDQFCPKCGSPQPDRSVASMTNRECPACGAKALKDDRFCPRCGTPLNAIVT